MVLLTIIQWVEVGGDFCWYWWNCWPSLNELKWEVIFVDIGGIVDHHSMSWGEKWFLLILVELLTITQWVEVRWFLLILVELLTITQWVEVRDHFCWYWWNCWPSLNEFRREVIFFDEFLTITQWIEVRGDCVWCWWNSWPSLFKQWWLKVPPISTKRTITSHLKKFKQWWSTIPPISTK